MPSIIQHYKNKEEVILLLQNASINGYVPGRTQMERKYGWAFRKYLEETGITYKELVSESGLCIVNFYKSSDGHILSSYYEYLFDEFLVKHKIPHQTDGRITETSRHRYDFKIGDYYIELWCFNSKNHINKYNENRKNKEKIYKDNNYKLISIELEDFSQNSIKDNVIEKKLSVYNIFENIDNIPKYPIVNNVKLAYWCDATITEELKIFMEKIGHFPTQKDFEENKKFDLYGAISRYSTLNEYAETMLGYIPNVKNPYSEEKLLSELSNITNILGHFPSLNELTNNGKKTLRNTITRNKGMLYYKKLILKDSFKPQKPLGYWLNKDIVEKEIRKIINEIGRFPTQKDLLERKLVGVTHGIQINGGYAYFQELILGKKIRHPKGYWKDENNIIIELKKETIELGKFPKHSEMSTSLSGALCHQTKKPLAYFRTLVELELQKAQQPQEHST